MRAVKARWEALTPEQRKTVITIGFVGVLLGLLYLFVSAGPDAEGVPESQAEADVNLLTGSDPKVLGLDALGAELRKTQMALENARADFKTENQALRRDLDRAESANKALRGLIEQYSSQTRTELGRFSERSREAFADLRREVDEVGEHDVVSAPVGGEAESEGPALDSALFGAPDLAPVPSAGAPGNSAQAQVLQVRVYGEETPASNEAAEAEPDVFIPAGSIISGVLVNGTDAPTGLQSKRDPMPALVRVKREAILPNRFRSDVQECFIIVGTTGDLSTERAFMRGETFSCIRADGGVIEQPLDGYAVGEDGKVGLRGRLVSRNGHLVAKGAAAGIADALSQIYRPVAIQGLNTRPGGDTLFQAPDTGDALEAAGYAGFGGAMRRLADYYIDLADQIVPFIEVDAGRRVDVVLLDGISLTIRAAR